MRECKVSKNADSDNACFGSLAIISKYHSFLRVVEFTAELQYLPLPRDFSRFLCFSVETDKIKECFQKDPICIKWDIKLNQVKMKHQVEKLFVDSKMMTHTQNAVIEFANGEYF